MCSQKVPNAVLYAQVRHGRLWIGSGRGVAGKAVLLTLVWLLTQSRTAAVVVNHVPASVPPRCRREGGGQLQLASALSYQLVHRYNRSPCWWPAIASCIFNFF
jgi:hypothetical protein